MNVTSPTRVVRMSTPDLSEEPLRPLRPHEAAIAFAIFMLSAACMAWAGWLVGSSLFEFAMEAMK